MVEMAGTGDDFQTLLESDAEGLGKLAAVLEMPKAPREPPLGHRSVVDGLVGISAPKVPI
jgi:hypothetical protein